MSNLSFVLIFVRLFFASSIKTQKSLRKIWQFIIFARILQINLAKGTLRFSFSTNNEYEEIDVAVAIIKESVEKLRSYSPTYMSKKATKGKRGRKKNVVL